MEDEQYPALFRSADAASNKYQRNYLNLIRAEYALLFIASVLSLSVFASSVVYAIATVVLGLSAAVLLTRAVGKPEQDWFSTFGCCVKIFVRVFLSNTAEA